MSVKKSKLTADEKARLKDFMENPTRKETYGDIVIGFFPSSVHEIEYENVVKDGKVVKDKNGKVLKREKDRTYYKLWERPEILTAPETPFHSFFINPMDVGYNPTGILSDRMAGIVKTAHIKRLDISTPDKLKAVDTHDTLDSLIDGIVRTRITDGSGKGFDKLSNLVEVLAFISGIKDITAEKRKGLLRDAVTADGVALRSWVRDNLSEYVQADADSADESDSADAENAQ